MCFAAWPLLHVQSQSNAAWYYDVEVRTETFVKCEDIEAACDHVRGSELTQEAMAEELREQLPGDCVLIVRGRHGQNIATTVEI